MYQQQRHMIVIETTFANNALRIYSPAYYRLRSLFSQCSKNLWSMTRRWFPCILSDSSVGSLEWFATRVCFFSSTDSQNRDECIYSFSNKTTNVASWLSNWQEQRIIVCLGMSVSSVGDSQRGRLNHFVFENNISGCLVSSPLGTNL